MSSTVFAASFVALYAGHMVADHVVQTDWQAAHKAGKGVDAFVAMTGHIGGYTITQTACLIAAQLVGVPFHGAAVIAGVLFSAATHAFIDRRWPVQWILRRTGSANFAALASSGMNGPYLTDQALHIGCLFVAALIIGGLS